MSVNKETSREFEGKSGVAQGTVLGPCLFIVFIDDLDDNAELIDLLIKFANDTKGMKIIRGLLDRDILQQAPTRLAQWAKEWGMMFNVEKCKIMHVG